MTAVTGAISQAAVAKMNLNMSLVKQQNEAQKGLIEMITASVDAVRGRNLDVTA